MYAVEADPESAKATTLEDLGVLVYEFNYNFFHHFPIASHSPATTTTSRTRYSQVSKVHGE